MCVRTLCSALGAAVFLAACSSKGTLPVRPGGADGAATSAASPINIVGTGTNAALDRIVVAFMTDNGVPNAELAVSSHGTTEFSHAYTYTGLAASTTTIKTLMRIASCTKPLTSAAIFNLVRTNKIKLSDKIFGYLGIAPPSSSSSVDPRIADITIQNMLDHKSGWDWELEGQSGGDPAFKLREIAEYFKLDHAVNKQQYAQYQLQYPLQADPGTLESYCNYCYDLLGMVVAKASGTSYVAYLQNVVITPAGGEVAISPTLNPRLPNEVANYYNTDTGLSSIHIKSLDEYPFPYSGDDGILEISEGDGGVATNAATLLSFMNRYSIGRYGLTPKQPELGKDYYAGEIPGTLSCAEQLPNGTNYAFIINKDQFPAEPGAFGRAQHDIQVSLYPPASTFKGKGC